MTGGCVIAEDQRQDQQEILEQRSAAVIAGIAAIDPDHVLHLADTIPAFDAEGQLVLATAEAVLWTGTATLAAQAAGGREQFTTLWKSPEKAAVTLTTQRLIYYLRDFTAGDMSWLIIGGATGPAPTALSAARAGSHHSGQTSAGQIRYANLARHQCPHHLRRASHRDRDPHRAAETGHPPPPHRGQPRRRSCTAMGPGRRHRATAPARQPAARPTRHTRPASTGAASSTRWPVTTSSPPISS